MRKIKNTIHEDDLLSEKELKQLGGTLQKIIDECDIQELSNDEKELDEWVEKQAKEHAMDRYHSKIDNLTLTAYQQGFIRGFYLLYNKLKEV